MSRPSVNARASSSGSQHGLSRSQLGASPNIAFPASPRKPSALPLPSLKHNRSFARLAQLFGIGKAAAAEQDEGDVSEEEEALEAEEGDEGDEGQEEVDEETLLWDAQSALIAHQPALAFEHYTQAALPPYRSSAACLALGHLLTRGSSLSPTSPTSPTDPHTSGKGKARAYSFASPPTSPIVEDRPSESASALPRIASRILSFFAPAEPEVAQSPPERVYTDIVSNGWAIPTDGKKAVRDVEGMGVAGGWYVLGLGWIVDGQHQLPLARAIIEFDEEDEGGHSRCSTITPQKIRRKLQEEKDASTVITFQSKRVKPKDRRALQVDTPGLVGGDKESSSSEGTMLKTPPGGGEDELAPVGPVQDTETTMKLLFDILAPLTRLYRNGHIQANDPVYLPPIQPTQLPDCLRPQGDLQKRRNVWHLGAAVARYILDMSLLKRLSPNRAIEGQRRAVQVMAHYILGMTASARQSARHFRIIVTLNHSGYAYPDELINQASQRLEILHRSPDLHSPEGGEYPFPKRGGQDNMTAFDFHRPTHRQTSSAKRIRTTPQRHDRSGSILSFMSSADTRITRTPVKNASVASLSELNREDVRLAHISTPSSSGFSALSSLRKVKEAAALEHAASEIGDDGGARWPSFLSWTYSSATPPDTSHGDAFFHTAIEAESRPNAGSSAGSDTSSPRAVPRAHNRTESASQGLQVDTLEVPLIRHIASTPTLGTLRVKEGKVRPGTGHATPDTFVNDVNAAINLKVDPVLAAAELNSALTKRVQCSVCAAKGVNFPECRRCGLVFCSRPCRVDETGAGNGKKHVCGAWESRKLLAPPAKDKRGKAVPVGSVKGTPKLQAYMQTAEIGTTPRMGGGGGAVAAF